MKAQSFLNWIGQLGAKKPLATVADVHHFYSQPFDPERIPELFEGWAYNGRHDGRGDLIRYGDTVFAAKGGYRYNYGFTFPTPQTLNDFIRDCERAGVELNWNTQNEDVKKAFGL